MFNFILDIKKIFWDTAFYDDFDMNMVCMCMLLFSFSCVCMFTVHFCNRFILNLINQVVAIHISIQKFFFAKNKSKWNYKKMANKSVFILVLFVDLSVHSLSLSTCQYIKYTISYSIWVYSFVSSCVVWWRPINKKKNHNRIQETKKTKTRNKRQTTTQTKWTTWNDGIEKYTTEIFFSVFFGRGADVIVKINCPINSMTINPFW